jgi:hypothetical protein
MTLAADWMQQEEAKRAWLDANGLYKAEDEHSSCGVGLVVALSGKPSRKVVENGISALKAVWHRGAVDADGKTGDGAGIHVQIPVKFFYDVVRRTGHEPDAKKLIAVGQVFLPRTDFGAQERCRTIVETEVLRMGHYIYGWRHVPVDISVLGDKANATRPEIEQILIRCEKDIDHEQFERELYIIRRRIEKAATASGIAGMYLCSLSCRSIIYKGMMLAEQVSTFYPDLQDDRFERLCDLPPALFDQHLPAVVAGAAVPHAGPQRRDQHAEGQHQLDEKPRDPHVLRSLWRGGRGYQADHPERHVRLWRAGRGVRGAGAVWPVCADGQDHAGARSLVEADGEHAQGLGRHVFLLQLGDRALGWTGGAGDDRWPLGLRRA